jgi:hypothetical protein
VADGKKRKEKVLREAISRESQRRKYWRLKENESFIYKKSMTISFDYHDKKPAEVCDCIMIENMVRSKLGYSPIEQECLSEEAWDTLERLMPDQEIIREICVIFERVWQDVMSQGLKYLDEENMEEIIASYLYHATMRALGASRYKRRQFRIKEYPRTHEAGKWASLTWMNWSIKAATTEELYRATAKLEEAMMDEKLLNVQLHRIVEAAMEIQEIEIEPAEQIQETDKEEEDEPMNQFIRMCREVDEIYEIECGKQEDGFRMEECLKEQYRKELEEDRKKKEIERKKLNELVSKNHVTIEEIKEISVVLNHGDQYVMNNEEHLDVNQVVPMNVHQSKEAKKKKKLQKRYQKRIVLSYKIILQGTFFAEYKDTRVFKETAGY